MTTIYYVRHAKPLHSFRDDRLRPLTDEGAADAEKAAGYMADTHIDAVLSSPYKRAYDTVLPFARARALDIITDERFREREAGSWNGDNFLEYIKAQWSDHNYHIEDGESINDVQKRNISALDDVLREYEGKTVVIGTHGTALSTVLNYFDSSFGADDFMRIIDFMPYIVKLEFAGTKLAGKEEVFHILKPYEQN